MGLEFFKKLARFYNSNMLFYMCRYFFSSDCIASTIRKHKNEAVRAAAFDLIDWMRDQNHKNTNEIVNRIKMTSDPVEKDEWADALVEELEAKMAMPLHERVLELNDAPCHQIVRAWVSDCEELNKTLVVRNGNIYWHSDMSEAEAQEISDYILSFVHIVVRDL